jgi:cell division protein FtsL
MSRSSLPISAFWMKIIGVFFLGLFLVVWENVEAQRFERQVMLMRREVDRLTYENGRLQTQIHQWTASSHLDSVARKDYGMEPPDPSRIIGIQQP